MYSQDFFAPASSWTPFYIPFDYFYTPVAPDSAYFYFLMSCDQSATLNTYLLLDDLSFDVMVGSEESNPALLKTSTYPNPASDELHIGFEAPAPGTGTIKLMDMTGRMIEQREFKVRQAGWSAEHFDTRQFPAGMYLADVRIADRHAQLRVEILR